MTDHPDAPPLSVVVVSFNPLPQLERCLRSLAAQRDCPPTEVLVVGNWSDKDPGQLAALQQAFPQATWVDGMDGTIPRLRSLGVEASRGDVVALLEDDCVVDAAFGSSVLRAHGTPHVAVGGAVEPGAYRRGVDWAAYLCDYSRFMLPFPEGDATVLPGNNVSYKREIVDEVLALSGANGLQETFVHAAFSRSGRPMKADPRIVVRNEHSWAVADVSTVPFQHGRAFGGQRAHGWPLPRRLAFSAAAVGLPVLQVGRILTRVLRRRPGAWWLVRALPWVVLFTLCWAAGECVGYARGAGTSLERWR